MKKVMKKLAAAMSVVMLLTCFVALGAIPAKASTYYYFKTPANGASAKVGKAVSVSFYAGVESKQVSFDAWGRPDTVTYYDMPVTLKAIKNGKEIFSQEYTYKQATTLSVQYTPNTAGTIKLQLYGRNEGLSVTTQTLQDTITIKVAKPKATAVKKMKPKIEVDRTAKTKAVITCTNDCGFGIKVYRANSKNGKYKLIKTTSKATFTDKKLKASKAYYYKVKLYAKKGSKTYTSKYSAKVQAPKFMGKVRLSYSASSGVKITWQPISGAGFYLIGKSTSGPPAYNENEQYICCGADELTYFDKEVAKGKTYYYSVFAFNSDSKLIGKHVNKAFKVKTQ